MQTDQRKLPSSDDVEQTQLRQVAQSPHEAVTDTIEGQQNAPSSDESQVRTEKSVYIMVPKTYSESVSLRDDGPRSTVEYSSNCLYKTPKTYVTQAAIVPRLIPKYYITMVRVDEEQGDTITYHERVEFVYTLRIKEFSETVNSFPKEVSNNFVTTLTYVPNYTHRHYVTSLLMEPAQLLTLPVSEDILSDSFTKNEIAATCNGEEVLMRSNCDEEQQQFALLNGTA